MKIIAAVMAAAALASQAAAYYRPDTSLPWMRTADEPAKRASILLNSMNLSEKLHMFHGSNLNDEGGKYVGGVAFQPRLNIPAIRLNDGPQGFRNADSKYRGTSTAWPSGLTIGSTFDVDAAELWGTSMGQEFLGKGANVQLGPGVCLARVPKCGERASPPKTDALATASLGAGRHGPLTARSRDASRLLSRCRRCPLPHQPRPLPMTTDTMQDGCSSTSQGATRSSATR